MLFTRHNYDAFIFHSVNKSMFIGNPSTPIPLKFMLKRFGFAGSFKWGTGGFINQFMKLVENTLVFL